MREIRERLGMSQAALADAVGTSQPQIRRLEAGERKLTKEWAEKIAPVLRTTAEVLLFGAEQADLQSVRKVTVAAHVQAGAFSETWEWDEGDQYAVFVPDDPVYRGVQLYAAETRGPSMNRRYPEGTIVVFTNVEDTGEAPIAGKRYVVERRRPGGESEHTVKLLHIDGDGKFWLVPESDDPRFQAPISIEDGTGDDDVVAIIGRVCFAVMRE